MDVDTTARKDDLLNMLTAFREHKAQVLVGTQMIAKGLDFPEVTVVGAVLADTTLNVPDYRAPERTFQLLTQVAGRAGRAQHAGHVVIQTYLPEHYAIRAAAAQDYRAFYRQEFSRRRSGLYPPFTMMARLLCSAPEAETAEEVSRELLARLDDLRSNRPDLKRRILFLRQDDAPLKRLRGLCRAQVLVKLLEHPDSREIISYMQELAEQSWPCEVLLEINPASLA